MMVFVFFQKFFRNRMYTKLVKDYGVLLMVNKDLDVSRKLGSGSLGETQIQLLKLINHTLATIRFGTL